MLQKTNQRIRDLSFDGIGSGLTVLPHQGAPSSFNTINRHCRQHVFVFARTWLYEAEMKFNEMKFKMTSLNDREMKSNEMKLMKFHQTWPWPRPNTTIYWILSKVSPRKLISLSANIRIRYFEFRQWSVRVTGPHVLHKLTSHPTHDKHPSTSWSEKPSTSWSEKPGDSGLSGFSCSDVQDRRNDYRWRTNYWGRRLCWHTFMFSYVPHRVITISTFSLSDNPEVLLCDELSDACMHSPSRAWRISSFTLCLSAESECGFSFLKCSSVVDVLYEPPSSSERWWTQIWAQSVFISRSSTLCLVIRFRYFHTRVFCTLLLGLGVCHTSLGSCVWFISSTSSSSSSCPNSSSSSFSSSSTDTPDPTECIQTHTPPVPIVTLVDIGIRKTERVPLAISGVVEP